MSNQDPPRIFGGNDTSGFSSSAPIVSDERAFMNGVFGWMAGGLAITASHGMVLRQQWCHHLALQ